MFFDVQVCLPLVLTLRVDADDEEGAREKAYAKMERAVAYFEVNHRRMLDEANQIDSALDGTANA